MEDTNTLLIQRLLDRIEELGKDIASVSTDVHLLKDNVKRLEESLEGFKIKDSTVLKVVLIIAGTCIAIFEAGSPLLGVITKLIGG